MKYEYKTVVGNVRMREQRKGESRNQWLCSPYSDLLQVDDPTPPDGDGWELVTVAFAPGECGPLFVAREWRREIKTVRCAFMPDEEEIRNWIDEAHAEAEEAARGKQKAIWQGQLDDAAAKYIAKKLADVERMNNDRYYR